MSSAGRDPAVALTWLVLVALSLASAASAACDGAATAPAPGPEAVQQEGSRMYMVPHLGKNPVPGPVTGAPPRPLARVPLSEPSVSVRRKGDISSHPEETETRREEKRSPHLVDAPQPVDVPEDLDNYYKKLLESAEKRRRRRKQHFGTQSTRRADHPV